MNYYLDTNVCIYFLKGKYSSLLNKLKNMRPDEIKIPAIVKAELLYGAEKSQRKDENIIKVNHFLLPYEIVPFDDEASIVYSKLRSSLESKGKIIGPNDLIIASIVITSEGILVTNNTNEFNHIKYM